MRRRTRASAAGAVVLALAAYALYGVSPARAQQPRNIIILLADGAAPTQWDFGRYMVNGYQDNTDFGKQLHRLIRGK